jgi:hypothetical protein
MTQDTSNSIIRTMEPDLVKEASRKLAEAQVSLRLSRELVVAYATLAAFAHHWPSRASAHVKALLIEFFWVREREPDRFLKQRRIAVAKLSEGL